MSDSLLGLQFPAQTVIGGATHPSRLSNATPSAADRIYAAIKADIVAGRVQPSEMLDETSLAESFGFSRTPIREALRRLEQDGLVVTIPRRGTFVVAPTVQDMQEIDEVRQVLEPFAARLAAGRIDVAALDRLQEELQTLAAAGDDLDAAHIRYLTCDSELHDLVLEAAGNRQLTNILRLLHDRLSAVRRVTAASNMTDAITEVLPLITALKTGDADASSEAMRRHVEAAHERRRQLLY
jgi:DNA-binding GntR family transcriptional regulator